MTETAWPCLATKTTPYPSAVHDFTSDEITVVFPVPGGPTTNALECLGRFNMFWMHARCSSESGGFVGGIFCFFNFVCGSRRRTNQKRSMVLQMFMEMLALIQKCGGDNQLNTNRKHAESPSNRTNVPIAEFLDARQRALPKNFPKAICGPVGSSDSIYTHLEFSNSSTEMKLPSFPNATCLCFCVVPVMTDESKS
jgi:hypothetical protein